MRKSFSAELMAKVALDAIKEEKDDSRVVLAVRGTQDTNNKLAETCVRRIGGVFQEKATRTLGEKEKVIDELYRQIGQLKVGERVA